MLASVRKWAHRLRHGLGALGFWLLVFVAIPLRLFELPAALQLWSKLMPRPEVFWITGGGLLVAWIFWMDLRPYLKGWWRRGLQFTDSQSGEHSYVRHHFDFDNNRTLTEVLLGVKNKLGRTADDVSVRVVNYKPETAEAALGLGSRLQSSAKGDAAVTLHPEQSDTFIVAVVPQPIRRAPPVPAEPAITGANLGSPRERLWLPVGKYRLTIGVSARDEVERRELFDLDIGDTTISLSPASDE